MTIYFYAVNEVPYGCFSNFSPHGFMLDDLYWPTSEHYYQAQKFWGTPHLEKVRQMPTPKAAASLGRRRDMPLRADWESVKDAVMQKAVLTKFRTHADLRELLLSTANELIIENSPIDYYWGCGQDGSGKNKLGETLMTVRHLLRQELGKLL